MPHMLVPGWAGVGGASPQPPTPRPCPHSKKRPPSDLSLQGQDFRVRRSLAGPQKMKYSDHESVSCSVVSDSFATPQTEAHQAPRSVGFFRQEYWSGLPFPSPPRGPYIPIITLSVNGLNVPIKRHRLVGQMKTCACMHFHLTISLFLTPSNSM